MLVFPIINRLCLSICFVFAMWAQVSGAHFGWFKQLRIRQELVEMMDGVLQEYDAPGAVLAVEFQNGLRIYTASGVANLDTLSPIHPQQQFRIGSASKTFTAKAILLLHQDGLLNLDDEIETLMPELEVIHPLHGLGITVRMLLNHTSGLNDYVAQPFGDSYFFYELIDSPLRVWSPEQLIEVSLDQGLAHPPGSEFLYSNTNYILLGKIIETVSGFSYEQFIHARLLEPLRLTDTMVPVSSGFNQVFASGYFEQNADGELFDFSRQDPSGVWSAGNIISTPSDLLRWLKTLINGDLLCNQVYEEQFDIQTEYGFGYGLGVVKMLGGYGHNGSVLGYQTQMFHYRDAYFVIYTNCYYLSDDVGNLSQIIFEKAKDIIFEP